jgi:hypothetical protein
MSAINEPLSRIIQLVLAALQQPNPTPESVQANLKELLRLAQETQEEQKRLREERDLYLNALYALQKRALEKEPIQRTAEDILNLEKNGKTLQQVIEEIAMTEGE